MDDKDIEIVSDAIGYLRSHAQQFTGSDPPQLSYLVGACVIEGVERSGAPVAVYRVGQGDDRWVLIRYTQDFVSGIDEFRELIPQPYRGFRVHGSLVLLRAFSRRVMTRSDNGVWLDVAEVRGMDKELLLPDVREAIGGADNAAVRSEVPDGGRDVLFNWSDGWF